MAGAPCDSNLSPVHPVGQYQGRLYVFDHTGRLVSLSASALGRRSALRSLFGDDEFLTNRFPRVGKRGNRLAGFDLWTCRGWLLAESHRRGLFDPTALAIRGVGVWPDAGGVAVHVGSRVLIMPGDGGLLKMRKTWFADRYAIWAPRPEMPAPGSAAAASVAQHVESFLRMWQWSVPGEERIFTGLWAAGLLGAAIDSRPHAFLVGASDSGKSALLAFYRALSPLAVRLNDWTADTLIRGLSERAAPLIIDEADDSSDAAKRMEHALPLLRRASAIVPRHGGGSRSRNLYRARFMSQAIIGAVVAPALLPDDAERITVLRLIATQGGAAFLPLDSAMGFANRHAAGLFGRALAGLPRFRNNLAALRATLLGDGCAARLAEHLGTILAAREMMITDESLSAAAAEDRAGIVRRLVQSHAQAMEESEPWRCLDHLLAAPADNFAGGHRPSYAMLVTRALSGPRDAARWMLVERGVKLCRYPVRAAVAAEVLLVARSHPALALAFQGTLWAERRWCHALQRLPGAVTPADPVSFRDGLKFRCVAIPLRCLLADDGVADDLRAAPAC
jgi:hypothetical protein